MRCMVRQAVKIIDGCIGADLVQADFRCVPVWNADACNWAIMFPERLQCMVGSPGDYPQQFMKLLEGLSGGRGNGSYAWYGDEAAIYHTSEFPDGENANPTGAILCLIQMLTDL
eukprot:372805_1